MPQALDDYRIGSAAEIQDLLRQLIDKRTMVTLSGPGGASYTTLMWSAQPDRKVMCFSVDDKDPRLATLLATDEVVAVAYLDSIKLQFDVEGIVLVRGQDAAINARYPRELYRFQRREFFRVKPLLSSSPVAHLPHPERPGQPLVVRILDISLGGVALGLPASAPMLTPGTNLRDCMLELDPETRIDADLHVQHITVLDGHGQAARIGCEIRGLHGDDQRALQHYINQTQKTRNALVER